MNIYLVRVWKMKSKFSNFFLVIYNPTQLLKLLMLCFDKGKTGVGEAAESKWAFHTAARDCLQTGVQHLSGGSSHFEAWRRFPAGIVFQWDALKDVFASFKCPVRINVPLPVQALYKVSDLSSSDCPWQH